MIMAKIQLQKNMVLLNLLVFSMILTGSAEGLVLCFGAGEHYEIETTYNGVNCGHHPANTSKVFEYYPSIENNIICKSHSSSCKDIPLKVEGLTQQAYTSHAGRLKLKIPAITIASPHPSTFTTIAANAHYLESSTATNTPLASLHNIVLLI